ncbi:MAG: NYN domain-containing protein [Acidimicrobiia bacterium]
MTVRLIDGNNVIGSVADGWWRDRPGAVRRLVGRLRCYVATTGVPLHVVFDVPQPDLSEGDHDGVIIHYATRRGRDAADDRILELLDEGFESAVEVVTSDRGLADGARGRGAHVVGAGTLLSQLADAGC